MAEDNEYNPIETVDNAQVIVPTSYAWEMEDISEPDAGRTEDMQMQKKRIGQVCAVTLGWDNVTTEQASKILKAFNPEYVKICYLNPLEGGFVERECHIGNRKAVLYDSKTGLWSNIGFKFTERNGVIR